MYKIIFFVFCMLHVLSSCKNDNNKQSNAMGEGKPGLIKVTKTNKMFWLGRDALGVNRGNKIDFYTREDLNWIVQPAASFTIP
ncbi:MAG TPA: hypothetical protein VF622_00685, partial [Segetibacter sp.]